MAVGAKHLGDKLSVKPKIFCPNASPFLDLCKRSNVDKIDNPRFLAHAQSGIRKASKELRRKCQSEKRKSKASHRWKKARKKVSCLQNKVANRRQDWVHKVAEQITCDNSLVATETLKVKNLTAKAKQGKRKGQKAGLNRSITPHIANAKCEGSLSCLVQTDTLFKLN